VGGRKRREEGEEWRGGERRGGDYRHDHIPNHHRGAGQGAVEGLGGPGGDSIRNFRCKFQSDCIERREPCIDSSPRTAHLEANLSCNTERGCHCFTNSFGSRELRRKPRDVLRPTLWPMPPRSLRAPPGRPDAFNASQAHSISRVQPANRELGCFKAFPPGENRTDGCGGWLS